jgi:hypothetical protein
MASAALDLGKCRRLAQYPPKDGRPSKIKFNWNFGLKDGPTEVTLELRPHAEGTVLQVTESNYHDTKEGRAAIIECATGWGEALNLIRVFAERGIQFK